MFKKKKPTAAPAETVSSAESTAALTNNQDKPVRNKFATEKKKRKLPKWLRITLWVVILAALGYGIYSLVNGFLKKDETPTPTAMSSRGTLSSVVKGYGSVVPKNKKEYGAKTQGTVTEVYVNAGDIVKTGDKLFSIDASDLMDELEAANTAKKNALTNLETAVENLKNTTVTAPFKGKLIGAPKIKQGEEVAAGTELGTLVDDSTMLLELYFSHAYINDIAVGQTANVSVSDSMTYTSGKVYQIDKIKKVSPDGSILFRVYISVPNPGTLAKDAVAAASVNTPAGEAFPYEGGKLDYINSMAITAKSGGKVTYANVMDYGEYNAGATILSVDPKNLESAVADAQKAYEEADKKVQELTNSIENTEIVAEIDGMVSSVMISPGDKLTASGTSVLSISDTSSLFVEVNIDELDVNKLQVGMPATITYNGGAEPKTWQGTLDYLSFEAKRGESNYGGSVAYFPAKIAVENDGTLLPNMNVDYSMTSLVKEDCLIVPSGAIVYSDMGTLVYVKNESLTGSENVADVQSDSIPKGFTPVIVEIGLSDDANTEILSGLTEGVEVASRTLNEDSMGGEVIMVG